MSNETIRTQNLPPVPEDEKDEKGKPKRYQYFGMILYPDCDQHMRLLRMFEQFPQLYHVVYILHDKDLYSQDDWDKWLAKHDGDTPNWQIGEHKKAHYHVMIKWGQLRDLVSMTHFLRLDWGDVQGVNDWRSLLAYFIHSTPDSWDKVPYPVEALQGDSKLISALNSKTQILYSLGEFADMVQGGVALYQIPNVLLNTFSDSERSLMLECFDKYEHFIVAMSNQFDRLERSKNYVQSHN